MTGKFTGFSELASPHFVVIWMEKNGERRSNDNIILYELILIAYLTGHFQNKPLTNPKMSAPKNHHKKYQQMKSHQAALKFQKFSKETHPSKGSFLKQQKRASQRKKERKTFFWPWASNRSRSMSSEELQTEAIFSKSWQRVNERLPQRLALLQTFKTRTTLKI